jgi:hypothetical protein
VAVFGPDCSLLWKMVLGPVAGGAGLGLGAVAFDDSGDLFVAGSNRGTINFGSGPLTSAGDYDVVVAKFDSTYHVVYAKDFGDSYYQRVDGMGVDALGNLYVGGQFDGTVDFGGGTLSAGPQYRSAIYVAKLDPLGHHLYSRVLVGTNPDGGNRDFQGGVAAVGPDGATILNGLAPSGGTIDLGGGPISKTVPDVSFQWVGSLGANGDQAWARALPAFYGITGRMANGDVVYSAGTHLDTINGPVDVIADFGAGVVQGPRRARENGSGRRVDTLEQELRDRGCDRRDGPWRNVVHDRFLQHGRRRVWAAHVSWRDGYPVCAARLRRIVFVLDALRRSDAPIHLERRLDAERSDGLRRQLSRDDDDRCDDSAERRKDGDHRSSRGHRGCVHGDLVEVRADDCSDFGLVSPSCGGDPRRRKTASGFRATKRSIS